MQASMKLGAQWSVKGIRPEARETAREAARRSGMSLGDWLNSVILHNAKQDDEDQYDEGGGEDPAAVHSRLDDISRRLDQMTRRGPEAYAPPHHRQPQYAPQAYAPPQPAYVPPPPVFAAAPSNLTSRLDNAVAEIAARRRALNGETAAPAMRPEPPPIVQAPTLAPAHAPVFTPQFEQPPAIVRAPMPAQDLSGLEDQLRQITDRIDTLRTPGVEEAIHALRGELAEIGHSLNEAMPRQAIDTIEHQIQSLNARIAEGREAGVDGQAIANIENGIAEVRDALYRLTPAENLAGFGEAIHGLDQKIDYIVAQKDPATLQQLEESIVTLRQVAEHIASNEAVSRVASDVAMLSEKIDRIAHAGAGSDALTGLEQRIAALSDAIAVRNQSGGSVPPKLEALVGSLTDKIEKLQGSRGAGDTVAFGHLEDRIVKLVEKLDASDSRLGHLEAIERGLGDLLIHIEEIRAHKPSTGLREGGNGTVDTLKQDIARTEKEIQAVHGALSQVIDRLATIERGLLGERTAPAPQQMPGKLAVRAAPAMPEAAPLELIDPMPAPAQRPHPAMSAPEPKPEPSPRPMPRAKSLPINPDLPADLPLEPGSGPPQLRLDPAARIAASEAALGNARVGSSDAPQGKSGFIAAARRAASAATKDKTPRAATMASANVAAAIDEFESASGTMAQRLKKKVKSLFVAASVIAIVIGGVQIASNYLNFFQPGTQQQASLALPQTDNDDGDDNDDVASTASTPEPAQVQPASPRLPGMIPGSSTFGFIGPAGQTGPVISAPQSADVTGALSGPRPTAPNKTSVPAITTPQTVPTEQIPIAIGSAKLRDAANKGDAGAAYEVAVRFAEGRGVPANMSESARWFERAAKAGLAQAQFRLGSLYEKGQGVKKDLEKARQNYVAAAAQGNGKALHNLAVLYAEGLAGKPDFATAIQWFQKASARGIADSQYNLAVLYARGLGGEKNLGESYKWFALAAAQGDKEAGRKRDEVASQLDAKDLAAAKHAVKTWTPVAQPAAATTVPEPTGGWDDATVTQDAPKVRASTGMVKVGRR
jgi:localization factor PodJL